MFFDDLAEVPEIIRRHGTVVLAVPRDVAVEIPGSIVVQPEGKAHIGLDQVRSVQENVGKRQVAELIVVVRPAEMMTEAAANAFLKTLEQPGEMIHFVLVTEQPAALLPTILSRAAVYVWRGREDFLGPVRGDEKLKKLARELLTAKGGGLVEVAKAVAKARAGETQRQALDVLGIAVEMCYKSFFVTGNVAFLKKIPLLIAAHQNIARGGNIKLQIVANLA